VSTINQSISRVRSLLLNPKEQHPTLDQLFTQLTFEFQNFVNELSSSNLPWNYNEVTINVSSGITDYLIPPQVGKILMAIANPDNNYGPVSLEFADLADVSADFYLFSPLDYGFSPDFNEAISWPFPAQIAFYRKDGQPYFRLAPFTPSINSIKLIYATGDWLESLSAESAAVLPEYHSLVEVRAAQNLLPGAEWSDDPNADQLRRSNLARSLENQQQRYAQQFMYAKRSFTGDQVTFRGGVGGGW
jgi:hypothetical protein